MTGKLAFFTTERTATLAFFTTERTVTLVFFTTELTENCLEGHGVLQLLGGTASATQNLAWRDVFT